MIRPVLIFSLLSLCASVCFGQTDTTQRPQPSSRPAVQIPGIDTPLSGPGTLLQSSPNPNAVAVPQKRGRKGRLRTSPPSDPRAFGVAIPLEGAKTKKDTLNR
ncbi:hypothetical protein [Spirosoma arcticum]